MISKAQKACWRESYEENDVAQNSIAAGVTAMHTFAPHRRILGLLGVEVGRIFPGERSARRGVSIDGTMGWKRDEVEQ